MKEEYIQKQLKYIEKLISVLDNDGRIIITKKDNKLSLEINEIPFITNEES